MFSAGGIVLMLENNSDGIDVVNLVCGNEKEPCIWTSESAGEGGRGK